MNAWICEPLSNLGYYSVNSANTARALGLSETGEYICTAFLGSRPVEVRTVLGGTLGPLQALLFSIEAGRAGRVVARTSTT